MNIFIEKLSKKKKKLVIALRKKKNGDKGTINKTEIHYYSVKLHRQKKKMRL